MEHTCLVPGGLVRGKCKFSDLTPLGQARFRLFVEQLMPIRLESAGHGASAGMFALFSFEPTQQ